MLHERAHPDLVHSKWRWALTPAPNEIAIAKHNTTRNNGPPKPLSGISFVARSINLSRRTCCSRSLSGAAAFPWNCIPPVDRAMWPGRTMAPKDYPFRFKRGNRCCYVRNCWEIYRIVIEFENQDTRWFPTQETEYEHEFQCTLYAGLDRLVELARR